MEKKIQNIFHYAKADRQVGLISSSFRLDNSNIPDVQDCYGTSSLLEIKQFWGTLERKDKDLFIQIICRTQAGDTFTNFLDKVVWDDLHDKVHRSFEKRYKEREKLLAYNEENFQKRRAFFEESKKPIYKRFRKLNRIISDLQFKITSYENQHGAILGDRSRLMAENKKYSKIKHLLQAINSEDK